MEITYKQFYEICESSSLAEYDKLEIEAILYLIYESEDDFIMCNEFKQVIKELELNDDVKQKFLNFLKYVIYELKK